VSLFLLPRCAEARGLAHWASERGHHVHRLVDTSELGFVRAWNRCARLDQPAFIVDYPIESPADISAIEAFIEHVIAAGGAWYYAPRPNDYVQVERAALVGMSPAAARSPRAAYAQLAKPYAKQLIALLPPMVRGHMRRLAVRAYEWSMVASATQVVAMRADDFRPQVQLPLALQGWMEKWQSWNAPESVQHRDLLTRVDKFFPHPLNFHVILLNKCNLKCVMCPYHAPEYKEAHTSGYFDEYRAMDEGTFRRIAEYAGRHGLRLQFGQIEEVLMHKRALDFFEIARDAGVRDFHLTTNGTLLTREKADRLAASGIKSVMFSIDAVDADTYQKIRGDDLEKLEKNIQYFMPLAKRAGISVTASFILQPQAAAERNRFLEKWKSLGVDAVTFYVLTEHDKKTGAMIRMQEMYDKGKRYPCASPWLQTVIFPEGEVSLCCKTMTDVGWRGVVSVGNIREQSFTEIWTGDRYSVVRSELLKNHFKDFAVCRNCAIWSASTSGVEDGPGYRRTYNETMETYQFL
jgi:MoaA/NifB/PqqE/SkfB family radical SAM enzyme